MDRISFFRKHSGRIESVTLSVKGITSMQINFTIQKNLTKDELILNHSTKLDLCSIKSWLYIVNKLHHLHPNKKSITVNDYLGD